MKRLVLFLFTLLSFSVAYAQPGSLSQSVYRSRVNDSTTVVGSTASGYSYFFWNNQATIPHWDFWNGSTLQHIFSFGTSTGGHVIEDEGTPVTQRANMNFTGAGVAVTDAGGKTVVTIGGGAGGTVTSVGFTGGLISVANPTTTPAFTVAGTSGGIPYFSSSSTWATSAALTANALVIGGGAGVAPLTTTTGTGVLTFLGTPSSTNFAAAVTGETGTGAVVLATSPALVTPDLGTPSAAVLTNASGYPASTETLQGIAEVATQSEVNTGTDDERIVTASKLNSWAKYKMVVLASDDTNNNGSANTMEDVGGLSFAVVTGGVYYFRFFIDYTSASTNTGSRWAINGPSATRMNYSVRFSTTATAESMQHGNTTYDATAVSGLSPTSGEAWVEGTITASADGTVVLRFASEVSSSAIVAKAGSILLYAKVN